MQGKLDCGQKNARRCANSVSFADACKKGTVMAQNILKVGNKIELTVLKTGKTDGQEQVYVSQITDIRGDDIIAAMPIFEGHIIPLETGSMLDVFFYTQRGIYKCEALIASRGREDNLHVMKLVLKTELEKFQRREYYRLPCTIDCSVLPLNVSDVIKYKKEKLLPDIEKTGKKGVIVDISGGGLRMTTDFLLEKNEFVAIRFPVHMNIGSRCIEVVGRIVLSQESEKRRGTYDNRIQFKVLSRELRDFIVKYIYEQQRLIQQRERG